VRRGRRRTYGASWGLGHYTISTVPATLRTQFIKRLEPLGVEHPPGLVEMTGFQRSNYLGKSFAHFHDDRELDIRLTQPLI
jgi:hypothetical protein